MSNFVLCSQFSEPLVGGVEVLLQFSYLMKISAGDYNSHNGGKVWAGN